LHVVKAFHRVVGVMSGTSLDGIDCALCQCAADGLRLERTWSRPMPKPMARRLHAIASGVATSWECGQAHHDLGRLYADVVEEGLGQERVDAVGLHGQTVFHRPDARRPATWQIGADSRYVHICGNETIHGVEFHELPDLKALGCDAPLVVDFSSHVASRPVDWSHVGLAFGGAQKNLGPAGLTLVIVREDLIGRALPHCPSAFDYKLVNDNQSMYNTPPTYSIYIAGLVFQWLKKNGGIAAMAQRNIAKAQLLYDFLDSSSLFENRVAKDCRSRMNVPFFLRDESRNDAFLTGAKAANLLQLKGHKSVGGMRASIYNAMPLEGVQALVAYMREFEKTQA
jgi:phosphoserine aminotransferase